MADYALSLLTTAQAMLSDRMSKPEMRHKEYSITKVMLKNLPALLPEYEMLKTSDSRAVEAYAFTKTATNAVTARAHAHTAAAFGDTQRVQLSFSTYGQLFKTSLKLADRNFMTAATMLSNRMEAAWIHLLDTIEAANATYLNTNKSQVQAASDGSLGVWDAGTSTWQVDSVDQNWYFQYLMAMMKVNNYSDMVDIINDPVAFAVAQQLANQGTSNATNTSFQFAGANLHLSTSLGADATYKGYSYLIPDGTVALLPWIPKQNREGITTRLQTYTNMNDPFGLGLNAALHVYETKGSTYDNNGEVQDEVYEYELSLDVASVKAPLSVATETTIFKAGLLPAAIN